MRGGQLAREKQIDLTPPRRSRAFLRMANENSAPWRIVRFDETEVERLPGKTHFWSPIPT
jgi:hypothetical protein